MKFARYIALACMALLLFHSCKKNTLSKIPHISLIAFIPDTAVKANTDSVFILFSFTDGNADIGNDTVSAIHVKDSRYPAAGFVPYQFPAINGAVEDPTKGLQGKCTFYPIPPKPVPRSDSLHMATGDTLTFEFYITDRAGDSSNHITTHQLIIRP